MVDLNCTHKWLTRPPSSLLDAEIACRESWNVRSVTGGSVTGDGKEEKERQTLLFPSSHHRSHSPRPCFSR